MSYLELMHRNAQAWAHRLRASSRTTWPELKAAEITAGLWEGRMLEAAREDAE